ncbi:MAG: GTPase HflX [Desulfobacterales bacterium]
MKRLHGNTAGLKANQTRRLEKLYRRRVPPDQVISFELARELSSLSNESRRQIGLLIDRGGRIVTVIIGDHRKILIPDLGEYRAAPGRLCGLRCLHTHLNDEPPSRDDLTDLALLRLDLMGIVTAVEETELPRVHLAHILPGAPAESPWRLLPPLAANAIDIDCLGLIKALEDEFGQVRALLPAARGKERALLVSVTGAPGRMARDSLAELKELAASSGIEVVDTVLQHRQQTDARFLMGRGKVEELTLTALNRGASLIVFDQDLNPSQIRAITDRVEIKVIDRTMLILDIFAQRALSREGKLQVELAQLKYMLPRLIVKNTAMSRLTGGIGGRGPGETKLEINRRRVRDRIAQLEKALILVRRQRKQQRARRSKKRLPIISIVGYTNAGKSTLLNTLTKSSALVENRLFATLDPSSRRLRFPRDIEVIITDTVGFIKDLPQDLVVAFRATLEELENADLLLHVIDISNPRHPEQIRAVESILNDLKLEKLAVIRVLNKQDLIDRERVRAVTDKLDGIAVSATAAATLMPLIERMQKHFLAARENRAGAGEGWPEKELNQ